MVKLLNFVHGMVSSVIGLNYQGRSDQFISVQWFQSRINAAQTELIEHRQEDSVTFRWESNFLNDTLKAKWLQIHSIDHGDGVFRPKLTGCLSVLSGAGE